jgi:hypothetical protein
VQNRRGPGELSRNVDDEGSVFFNSPDALVPQDVNGQQDVYEYREGLVQLISSGTSSEPSTLLDASADGTDVFFTTSQRLLRSDASDGLAIYDARRQGGLPEPVVPPECGSSGCRNSLSAQTPLAMAPASATFSGSGDFVPTVVTNPQQKAKAKKPTRKQLLARALKACKHRASKRRRAQCERQARRKYGPKRPARHGAKRSIDQHQGAK